jgi:hypothetical protein
VKLELEIGNDQSERKEEALSVLVPKGKFIIHRMTLA